MVPQSSSPAITLSSSSFLKSRHIQLFRYTIPQVLLGLTFLFFPATSMSVILLIQELLLCTCPYQVKHHIWRAFSRLHILSLSHKAEVHTLSSVLSFLFSQSKSLNFKGQHLLAYSRALLTQVT